VRLFNIYAGNRHAGERGLAGLPDRVSEYRQAVDIAIEYAQILGGTRLNCLAGLRNEHYSIHEQMQILKENLIYTAQKLEKHAITLLIEHINPFDVPGFLISSPYQAFQLQAELHHPNLKVQFDIYHAQRTTGELAGTLERHISQIGHIQLADNPGRHQPGSGEINFPFLLNYLGKLNYNGYVGLEYFPLGNSEKSLGWITDFID
jgi:hydroxypyruvate isomerase